MEEGIYRLLRLYEDEGLLTLKKAFILPKIDSMPYDPNSASIWNNENLHYNDCLYEYREVANYISVHSPDEILMAPMNELILPIIEKTFTDTPKAAYLYIPTVIGYQGDTCV